MLPTRAALRTLLLPALVVASVLGACTVPPGGGGPFVPTETEPNDFGESGVFNVSAAPAVNYGTTSLGAVGANPDFDTWGFVFPSAGSVSIICTRLSGGPILVGSSSPCDGTPAVFSAGAGQFYFQVSRNPVQQPSDLGPANYSVTVTFTAA